MDARALPSRSRDLTLSRQKCREGGLRRPRISGRWVGALVASLRSHILRPGADSIADSTVSSRTFLLPPVAVVGYNYFVLPDSVGRF